LIKLIKITIFIVVILSIGVGEKKVLFADNSLEEIRGIVVNSTTGQPIAETTITLYIEQLDKDSEVFYTTTNIAGAFAFESIEIKEDALYWLSIFYEGIGYTELFDVTSDNKNLVLQVYDTTTSDESISIYNSSILFSDVDHLNRELSIIEMVTLQNTDNLTYIQGSGPMDLLRFGLPEGATDLIIDTEIANADWVQIDKGFALLASVKPGKHELMYAYKIPYSGSSTSFVKNWRYGSNNLRIVIPENLFQVVTNITDDSELINLEGINYEVQEAKNIKRMEKMEVFVSDLPEPTMFELIKEKFVTAEYMYVAPISLGLFLLIGLSIFIWKNGNSTYKNRDMQLIDQMIDNLQKDFNQGKISEEKYIKMIKMLEDQKNEVLR
tara:strand:+ start:2911 stop:4056 length:1146 start_codon:yes stop_codon:yes gene_type:complete